MPIILGLVSLLSAGYMVIDKTQEAAEETTDNISINALYIGGLLFAGVGAYILIKQMK